MGLYEIMDKFEEYIANYAEKNGVWTDWEEEEEVKAELSEHGNIIEMADKANLDFYEVYKTALDLNYNKFRYKIVLSYYNNPIDSLKPHTSVWYSNDKEKLANKFKNDKPYYTEEEIYRMIEKL